jgi:hypothetical protein
MRHGRFIAMVTAAAATLALAPTVAAAAQGSLTDDSVADFSQGTVDPGTAVADPGSVTLKRSIVAVPFGSGPGLPGTFTGTPWPGSVGTASVASGVLTVNGELVKQNQTFVPGQVMEFTGTFTGEPFQHVGFSTTLADNEPYAIISTASGNTNMLWARTFATGGSEVTTQLSVTTGGPHTFRIEWSPSNVKYYVDGTLEATHQVAIPTQMSAVVSDASDTGGTGVTVSSLGEGRYATSGTFQSRVLDTGEPTATWGSLSATGATTGVTFKTRSGNTPTPDGSWTSFADVVGGVIQSPGARYIQYQAALTTADDTVTPSVDSVHVGYVDNSAPSAAIDGAQVTGAAASFAFSSPAADVVRFECSLDGGAFGACTSPKDFTGLAPGAHTVTIHAVDRTGNTGPDASKSFSIASPTSTSGSGQSSGGQGTTPTLDTSAPRVTFVAKSLRASKKGTIGVRVGCPATEASCRITIDLKRGKTLVAHKTVTVTGGKTKNVTLQLTKASRRTLSKAHTLKVSALITARDAAGNKKATTKKLTLRG